MVSGHLRPMAMRVREALGAPLTLGGARPSSEVPGAAADDATRSAATCLRPTPGFQTPAAAGPPATLPAMLASMATIFITIILPLLLVVALGALVQRMRGFDQATLAGLCIWLLVPAFLFVHVYDSALDWAQIGQVALGVMVPQLAIGLPLFLFLRRRATPRATAATLTFGSLVFNAGNFGIPIALLLYESRGEAFPGMAAATDGVAVQAVVVMLSNISTWCVGYMILALCRGDGWRGALAIFKLPMPYALVAAFILRDTDTELPQWFDLPVRWISAGAVPIMLVALGAQLIEQARWPNWRRLGSILSIKLLLLPAVTWVFCWLVGLWPWPGAQLVIASAAPAAVNTFILARQLDCDVELAADAVFWTTVCSAVTVTVVVATVIAAGGA